MKKIFIFSLMLTLCCTAIDAQKGKWCKSVPRKTTSSKISSAPRTSVNKKCAIMGSKATAWFVDKDYIYYVEDKSNNAVKRIDRKTGNLTDFISGIDGIYEGARLPIADINICGGKVLLTLKKSGAMENNGVLIYNNSSVKTSPYINKVSSVLYSCDNYLVTKDKEDGYANYSISWRNPKNLQIISKINYYDEQGDMVLFYGNKTVWAPDGCAWYISGLHLYRLMVNGKKTYWDLSKQSYVAEYLQNQSSLEIKDICTQGDYLYMACGRRIYRINMVNPNGISEYAKMPANIDNTFEWVRIAPNGDMLTQGNSLYGSRKSYNTQFWKSGDFDNPLPLGGLLRSGFDKYGFSEIWVSQNPNCIDSDGNLVVFGTSVYIYNPNGVVGYTNAVGKIL